MSEIPDFGIGQVTMQSMTEVAGSLHFEFTFAADGSEQAGVADIALASDLRGSFLSPGETFAAIVAESDTGGEIQLFDADADVTGPIDATKLIYFSTPVVGSLASPNVQFAPLLSRVAGPCTAGISDGGEFAGVVFRSDDGDVTVAAGDATTITKDGVAFVAGVPYAFFRAGADDPFSGFAYLWRAAEL